MRLYSLHAGLLKSLEAVDTSSRSRLGYPLRPDLAENARVRSGLGGSSGRRRLWTSQRDGVPNFVATLESTPANTASRRCGL
jgi:hypothetical protein